MGTIPAPVDPSTIPTLSGVFAPVTDEHDVGDLVVQGEIPPDLRGAYFRNGTVTHGPDPVALDASYMIHDFVITPRYVVLVVAPARFDLNALLTGSGPPLGWHGDEPVRIAVIPRTGTSADVQWIQTDPFWAYHFANGFEDGNDIVFDFSKFSHFSLGGGARPPTGAVTRARLDLDAGTVILDELDDRLTEFPRIDDRLQTLAHRWFTVSGKSDGLPMGQFNLLLRVDTHTGKVTEWDSGRKVFDEVVFAPGVGSEPERGYYTAFRTDLDTLTSQWFVLDADDITAGPVATVDLPFRVPNGLHGNWFTPSDLA